MKILPLIIVMMNLGCTVQNWLAATQTKIAPYRIEGLLTKRNDPTQRQLVVSYRIDGPTIKWYAKWYVAIPVDNDLRPKSPYTFALNKREIPTPTDEQLAQVAATPFSVEASHRIETAMHSRNFIRIGLLGGVGMLGGKSGYNEIVWMRYWPMSAPPKSMEEAVSYGYVVLLPPSYPRPEGDRIVSIGLTAIATPATLVGDAAGVPVWAMTWNNPDLYDDYVHFDEWLSNQPLRWMWD